MAQILVPTATDAAGSWTPADPHLAVDDDSTVSPTGDDVVATSEGVGNNTATTNLDLALGAGSDPVSSTGHVIRARWNHSDPSRSLQAHAELWQGVPGTGTLVASLDSAADVGATEVLGEYTLTATEADAITDYSALHLRLWGFGTGGGPGRSLVVDLVELELPDAPPPPEGPFPVASAVHAGDPTTSATVTLPATAAGDVLILVYHFREDAIAATPGGTFAEAWTTFLTLSDGAKIAELQWARATGDHSGETVTVENAAAGSTAAAVMVVRDANSSGSPIDVNSSTDVFTQNIANGALVGFNTTVDNALVCYGLGCRDDEVWSDQTKNAVAMTEQIEALSAGGTVGAMVGLATLAQATVGATGDFDCIQAQRVKAIFAFAIVPTPEIVSGSAEQTLPALTQAASGELTVTISDALHPEVDLYPGADLYPGPQSVQLPALTSSATGQVGDVVEGSAAQVLPALVQDAAGVLSAEGSAAQTLPALVQAAEGVVGEAVSGSAAQTLPALTQAASGALSVSGEVAQTLPALEQEAVGTIGDVVAGSAAQTLPALVSEASGELTASGDAASVLPALVQDASGSVGEVASGEAAQVLPALVQTASGEVTVEGASAGTLPSLVSAASGEVSLVGAAAQSLPALVSQAEGALTVSGVLESTLPALESSAAGSHGERIVDEHAVPIQHVESAQGVVAVGQRARVRFREPSGPSTSERARVVHRE